MKTHKSVDTICKNRLEKKRLEDSYITTDILLPVEGKTRLWTTEITKERDRTRWVSKVTSL
jgi:hypothetical protein